mgnify:FL=1
MLDVEDPRLPGEELTVELHVDGTAVFKSYRIGQYIATNQMENLDDWC